MKEIREWLEKGQDYAQGVALYESHGSSRVVLKALQYGATAFTRQKLAAELRKLLAQEPVYVVDTSPQRVEKTAEREQVRPVVPTSPPAPPPKERGEGPAATPEVQAQRRAWFAERNHLHPQLELVATDAERLVIALRILEVSDLITRSYAAEAAPAAALLATPGLTALEHEGEMRRLLANLRPQRTKLRKRSDRATDLAQVESDIKLLEERLKRNGGEPQLHQGHRDGA